MVINELLDVLFWKNTKKYVRFYTELIQKYLPDNTDEYRKQSDAFVLDSIQTKENFIKIIEDYNANGKPIWQEQAMQNCDVMGRDAVRTALQYGSRIMGEQRFTQHENAISGWAYHADDYAKAVNVKDNINILELSTGAGLGTCIVMKHLLPNNYLISVDIDFVATRNADGLAQYMNLSNRVCGLNANFWHLPFEDGSLDMVCTHYGLDETGEIETTVKEVFRVLKPGGRFVVLARKDPYVRHKHYMNLFDISEIECNPLLKKARLYSGFDDLVEMADIHHLSLFEHTFFQRDTSHHRILYIFQK